MEKFDNEAEQLAEEAAEADNTEEIVFKSNPMKEKYFRYLLNEMKRANIPLNRKVCDEINEFIKTERGIQGLNMFKLTNFFNYCK